MAQTSLPLSNSTHKICSIPGCDGPIKRSKSWCTKHYQRWKAHGDPLITKLPSRDATLEERFWMNVTPSGANECWEWQGHRMAENYGVLTFHCRPLRAHRVSWQIHNGREPVLPILHSCDNPPCVNPAHLREGTIKENARDMMERNRRPPVYGEKTSSAKLTNAQAMQIKTRLDAGEMGNALAVEFNVAPSTISSIKSGSRWGKVLNKAIGK